MIVIDPKTQDKKEMPMLDRELVIKTKEYTPIVLLRLSGFLAQLEVYKFKSLMETMLLEGHKFLILDLSSVTFIDSAGIGSLTQMRMECQRLHGQLTIVQPKVPQVKNSLEVSALQRVIDFHPDVETALYQMRSKNGIASTPLMEDGEVNLNSTIQCIFEYMVRSDERLHQIDERLSSIEAVLGELKKRLY